MPAGLHLNVNNTNYINYIYNVGGTILTTYLPDKDVVNDVANDDALFLKCNVWQHNTDSMRKEPAKNKVAHKKL